MASSSSLQQMAPSLIARSKTLINNDLKRILRDEGAPSSGVKATLQARVVELINRAVSNNDHTMYNRLQHRISNNGAPPPALPAASPFASQAPVKPSPPVNGNGHLHQAWAQPHANYHQPRQVARQGPTYHFKESPFFEIRELVLDGITLEASPSHRQNCSRGLTLSDSTCARMRSDPSLRLLLFSALEQPLAPYARLDIAFPSQIEVRVNGEEAKANYKGLKNKPGSTRPADITALVRTAPANYRNNLLVTYALTQKASENEVFSPPSTLPHLENVLELTSGQRYNLFVYMVRKYSVEELTERIVQHNVITKQSVLSEMKKKANDPDIVVESSVMSLKDPVSTLKITTPCRSTVCTHNRCFDAASFLQLQEQAPTWQCPICNKTVSFEALAVDEYVQEILSTVSSGVDQVTIEPDGQWSTEPAKATSNPNGYHDDDDSDEDLVEVPGPRVSAIKSEVIATPQSLARTPPMSSREASSAPRTGSKRTSEVIDLTLSDDDEPPRPTKKVAYSTPNSLPDPMRRYHYTMGTSGPPAHPQAPSHSMSSSLPMDPPSHHRHSYDHYHQLTQRPYPRQGDSTYSPYIDSSP
ncbi:hypothetical protein DM02DRAFT_666525 [Periconia macrospinosa]|uniref:E3 SUMO-protein ligase PIAS1 n=1 Tax=Periconia macrospinosa TaxID=97972 RepID=A0A2V1EAP5_9PLEO|nr:hypothetical protein DM02DRAFT_666525 [Periconia macrospinosa]